MLLLLPLPDDEADEQVLLARVKFFDRRFGSLTDFPRGPLAPKKFLFSRSRDLLRSSRDPPPI